MSSPSGQYIAIATDRTNTTSITTPVDIFARPLPGEYAAQARLERRINGKMDTTDMVSMGDSWIGMMKGAPRLDADYMRQWREEKAAALARGEDPYADLKRRAEEQSEMSWVAKVYRTMGRGWKKAKGEKKGEQQGTEEKAGEAEKL